MKKSILIILLFAFFNSCNQSPQVLNKKEMQDVLWDMFRADALAQQLGLKDSLKKLSIESVRLTRQVFLIHKISQEQFEKSYSYYTHHPDILSIILDSINTQQNRKANLELLRKNKTAL